MLSVIVPVFNSSEYLSACIESICAQAYSDLEIILVDDGSTDGSGAICDAVASKDMRIKVIHQANQGLSGARNAGLSRAKGEYVAFVDSDDTIAPQMYYQMMKHVDSADIIICGCQKVAHKEDVKSTSLTPFKTVLSYDELWEEVFGKLNNSACNKIYKRSIIGRDFFPVGLLYGEDLLFNLSYISKCKNGVMLDRQYYHYFQRVNSITRSSFQPRRFLEISAKDKAREFVERYYAPQLTRADLFCFRARMNVLRSIVASDEEENYKNELQSINRYLQERYPLVRKQLRPKERVEYYLYRHLSFAFRLAARKIG